jgi:protein ImuB
LSSCTNRRIACIRIPASPTAGPGPDERAALAGALLAAAPRVVPVRGHPLAFWADAGGMERRGGDAATARALLEAARGAGQARARVGIAGSCVAAAAATRAGGSPWRVVGPGADAAFLARRTLAVLPMPDGLRDALTLLGLERCGELAALAAADVELRFGREGVAAWRLARGDDPRWPFRPAPPGQARAEAEFEPPLESAEPLRFVLGGLVASVSAALAERQRIPAALRLVLRLDGGGVDERPLRPARPTADPRVLGDLCRRALEERTLPAPVAGVALEACEEAAPRADQLDAFRAPAPDPAALHGGLLPVFARWGEGALSRAVPHGAHLPGEHAAWQALGAAGIAPFAAAEPPAEGDEAGRDGKREAPAAGALGMCLRRFAQPLTARVWTGPEGRPVRLEVQGGTVASVRNPGVGFPPGVWKTRAAGPERISGAWWARATAREYWMLECDDGRLGLVYRDASCGGWYLEGWYD